MAVSKNGDLLGIRGQDYFVIKPNDKMIKLKSIPAQCGARPPLFLRVDPQGRLWGGPSFGQTLFWMDPARKRP